MGKLGFVLRATDSGEREILHINKDMSWAGYISDTRQYIKTLKNFDATGKIVYLLRFLGKSGYLFAIIKARPHGSGKPGDNTSAWIHIPAKSNISSNSLILVIRGVEREISAQSGINEIALKELFSHEYEEKKVLSTAVENIKSNEDGNIGYRYFGKGTGYELEETLGDEIAQIEYKKYRGIFLINSQSEIEPSDHCVLVKKLNSISTITNPKVEKGYVAYIDDVKFSAPIEVPCPYNLNILLKKKGYKDIPKSLQISQPNQIQKDWEIQIKSEDCLRCIQEAWFHAYDCENNESLTSKISIKVDGQYFNNEILYVPENLNNHHNVEIQCNGYEPFKENIEISDNVRIGLKAEEHEETFILPKQDGNGLNTHATIIIKTKKNSNSMPLKGYTVDGNKSLCYNNNIGLKIKWFFIGFISLFVIGVLYQGYVAIDGFFDNHEFQLAPPFIVEKHIKTTTDDVVITGKAEVEQPEATNLDDKAIEYLNRHEAWIKDSLENYEITKGLFDAMNAFELESLTSEKYSTLMQSERFSRIFYAAQECLEQNIDVKKGTSKGHYNNKSTDNKITVDDYTQWLQNAPHETKTEGSPTKTIKKSKITNQPIKSSQGSASTEQHPPRRGEVL